MIKGLLQAGFNRPSRDFIGQATDYLLFSMPAVKTEVALVMGAGTVSACVAAEAAELYHAGRFKNIIIAGGLKPAHDFLRFKVFPLLKTRGINLPEKNETEAAYMKRVMVDSAVPESAIKCDLESSNTGQNVENAIKLGLDKYSSITIVTLAYHQRRALGTVRKHLSDNLITTHGVYPLDIRKDNWTEYVLGRYAIMDEAKKVGPRFDGKQPDYIAKGFAREVNLAQEVQRANALLKSNSNRFPPPQL